jgi:hypothetical protein
MKPYDLLVIACCTVVLVSIATCRNARASDFDTTDKILFGSFVGLQLVDAAQTSYVSKHPEQFKESNPLYGSHPSDAKIIAIKSLLVGGVYYLVKDMPSPDRKFVLGAVDLFYITVTAHNASIGVKIGF